MQRQYVVQQPPRQFVRSAPPPGTTSYVVNSGPPVQKHYVTTSAVNPPPPPPQPAVAVVGNGNGKNQTTTVVTTSNGRVVEAATVHNKISVEGQMAANTILAGFLLFGFIGGDVATSLKEAQVISMQLVAFGCFLSATSFYIMYMQAGGKHSMRSWVYCAQILSMIGLVLLVAVVTLKSKVQMGDEYKNIWMGSIIVTIVLVVLPIVCNIGFCCTRVLTSMFD